MLLCKDPSSSLFTAYLPVGGVYLGISSEAGEISSSGELPRTRAGPPRP